VEKGTLSLCLGLLGYLGLKESPSYVITQVYIVTIDDSMMKKNSISLK
jgi:hypothetical protein